MRQLSAFHIEYISQLKVSCAILCSFLRLLRSVCLFVRRTMLKKSKGRDKKLKKPIIPADAAAETISGTDQNNEDKADNRRKISKNSVKRIRWKKRREAKMYSRKERASRKAASKATVAATQPTETDGSGKRTRALDYLHRWQHDRENWSFKKNEQTWLIRHALNDAQVSHGCTRDLLR